MQSEASNVVLTGTFVRLTHVFCERTERGGQEHDWMNRRLVTWALVSTAAAAASSLGCESLLPCTESNGCRLTFPTEPDLDNLVAGVGVEQDCSVEDCRAGLQCVDDRCEVAGTQTEGEQCVIGPECTAGLSCSLGPCPLEFVDFCPVCLQDGTGQSGASCESDLDCESGLKCDINGFFAQCVEAGTSDLGQACNVQADCFQGLFCNQGECSTQPPLFDGVECEDPDEENVVAYFSVPGADGTRDDIDYFQFPFPNDFRLGPDGRPDLGDFPTPGPGLLGIDIVQAYVEAIETHARGWSTNPTAIFRFSGPFDLDSFQIETDGFRGIEIIDVDMLPADPEDGVRHHSTHYTVAGRSNYVCHNWLAVRSPRNTLVPGHRYVIMLRGGTTRDGDPIGRPAQFEAMLADSPPSGDEALEKAYEAYEPLRELIEFYDGSSYELDPDTITVATVMTTGDVPDEMRQLAQAVLAEDPSEASEWVKCGAGVDSPCAQADEDEGRACGVGSSDYDEYQALLEIPIFQEGEAPYLNEGGAIQSSVQRRERICMSLSIPTASRPDAGWPLVIYGHGTGGSFRSHLTETVAGRLAAEGTASLGFDQVQHGPRRGEGEGADQDPDNLFFNFTNPDAAQGNPLQGAADVLSVLRFARQGAIATAQETGADAIEFDPRKIALYGHSQGSTHSSIALPFSGLSGGVLSGNGGGLVEALLNKTNPVNIAGAIPYVVQDVDPSTGQLRMGDKHPVLSLLQHYVDPADPVNFAGLLVERPEAGEDIKSVFQTFGLDDTYSPPATLARYVYAAGRMALAPAPSGVDPEGDNALNLGESSDPVSANVTQESETATLVCRQYAPVTDGHFVADQVSEANDDVIAFLQDLIAGQNPTVPAP